MDQLSLTSTPPTPVLRWAGGKRWLVPQLCEMTAGLEFGQYHEPFFGGGSVFFGLLPSGKAYLSDLNSDLIETYTTVRDQHEVVAAKLAEFENSKSAYYRLRDSTPTNLAERAARFIFLNHTSFNGIYRVNLRGVYNVPYGYRPITREPDANHLAAVAKALGNAHLSAGDFLDSAVHIRAGDLVFLDPPYTVAHNNNGFVKYNQHLFSFDDQRRLSQYIDMIKEAGAFYIMTNAAHQSIAELFDKGDCRLTTTRRNSVGGSAASRGAATEYLFTNVAAR